MAKKYIKDNEGIVRAVTSDNLQLEKPLLNENYDVNVFNRNMDKIDNAIQEVKGKIDGLELVAERVSIADPTNKFEATNVEDALLENKTSILNNTSLANQALTKANEAFLRGDNVKTQLVDKLISEGLNVSTNNTFEELIGSIALGKKWASGTNSIDTSKYNFGTRFGGSSLNGYFYNLTVSGLSFKPSFIMAYVKPSNTNYPYLFTVMSNIDNKPAFSIYGTYYNSEYNGYNYMLTTDTNYHISNGSFNVPIMRYGGSIDYNNCYWVAYE